jgi:hypothetical protein
MAQHAIGWQAFLEGCVLKDWAAKQQAYYDWLQKKNTGKRWTTTLIQNYGKSHGTCGSSTMVSSGIQPHLPYFASMLGLMP